jgi:hypothetical protein
VSLCFRERRQLCSIEARLFRADSHLAGMLDMFSKLYNGQDMPVLERVTPKQERDRRAVTWMAAAFAALALAISVMFSAAVALATSVRRARGRPSAASPERTGSGREADGQQNPPG